MEYDEFQDINRSHAHAHDSITHDSRTDHAHERRAQKEERQNANGVLRRGGSSRCR